MLKLLYIIIAILLLGLIVTVHELGHYLAGRLCGIGILEFSVGFGPKLFGRTYKGIDYSLRAVPLGGYCRFLGEDEKNADPRAMNNQPVWKRFVTVLAGPAMNFVLAFIFCIVFLCSFITYEYLPRVSQVYEGLPAESIVEVGDIVKQINGSDIDFTQDGVILAQQLILDAGPDSDIDLTLLRNGESVSVTLHPARETDQNSGEERYMIGIAFGSRTFRFGEALSSSGKYMFEVMRLMIKSLRDLIFHGEGADEMMGPVGIISFVSDQVYSEKMYAAVYLIFILSLNIGIMNLLPLPALDGGRLIFLIIEGIRRKPIPPEKEGMVHAAGLVLLFALMLFITYKDIVRLFTGG